ncbi:MAG: DedA family protein [Alphaproteobacteria bacterium]|nr:DedA family protein [Alphaproteobacteria bacterium]MBU0796223.1 DedA family protein [Alphaproteobacteria bacterium]MBU0888429.1 DedA family protein [Alphaproteobacteria bacterium]MBU1813108.1 DedA family protein [Alphaproteobacteria bacterium]
MIDWISDIVAGSGYPGIVFLMFVENIFPPIPSELIMPLAGFAAAKGNLSLAGVVMAGTLGSVLGALPWYYAGRAWGLGRFKQLAGRHGRWLTMGPEDVEQANAWFDRHRGRSVLLGRLMPTVRTLISVPAGIARMSMPAFLLFTALGTAVWTAVLAFAGYLLQGSYEKVAAIIDPLSLVVMAGIIGLYIYRLLRGKGA